MASTARKRVFIATVVPAEVDRLEGAKGSYTRMRGATIQVANREDKVRTVMAFGKPNAEISDNLLPGVPVRVAVVHDGGTLRVVGLLRTQQTADSVAEAAPEPTGTAEQAIVDEMPQPTDAEQTAAALEFVAGHFYADVVRVEVGAILAKHGIHEDVAAGIVDAMIEGESRLVGDEELPFSAETAETFGHLLAPLVDGGVDHATSLEIVADIIMIPAGSYLDDVRTLREQQSALAIIA